MAEEQEVKTYAGDISREAFLGHLQTELCDRLTTIVKDLYGVDLTPRRKVVSGNVGKPKNGLATADTTVQLFFLSKDLKKKKPQEMEEVGAAIGAKLVESWPHVRSATPTGPYLNICFAPSELARVVDAVLDEEFLSAKPQGGKQRVMVEYSQPNTHKAFHVGHMRNVALGDCLVRLYEHIGHPVVAANYFGDEGAHVAKCLWYMKDQGISPADAPAEGKGEWLGRFYQEGVNKLALSELTSMPYLGIVCAEVAAVEPHPAEDAPKNWHVVKVHWGGEDDPTKRNVTVVCGGEGYKVGDKCAYAPVGTKFNRRDVVPKDMKGVESSGLLIGYREAGIPEPPLSEEEKKALAEKEAKAAAAAAEAESKDGDDDQKGNKKKSNKKNKKNKKKKGGAAASNRIWLLPADMAPGTVLTEAGRRADAGVPADKTVAEEYGRRTKESADLLRAMEEREPEATQLWEETKQMSLDEFRRIYAWLGARFDHDFYESEVGEESLRMVQEYFEKGILVEDHGAVVADLTKFKLGKCVLRKSNGSGLYATKDLALARRKFDQFNIDKSIYVVDAAQSLHFQQVFKTLEIMGYEKAKDCFHLAYGLVVLPHGKMSSRKGDVIFFSRLREMLYEQITADFLQKYQGEWPEEEIEHARRAIAVGTIRYGMLKTNPTNDIVFVLKEWAAKSGDTGPYMMYAYTRLCKMLTDIPVQDGATVDYAHLDHALERQLLCFIHDFWPTVHHAASRNLPVALCSYLFDMAKCISSWYEVPDRSIKKAEKNVQATRLRFIGALAATLKRGLTLLGIETLTRM